MYTHSETGIAFPKAIGSYQLGETKPYKGAPGEAGVAISYHAVDAEATIFIRHLSPEPLKTASDLVEESLTAAKEMEKNRIYKDVKIYRSSGAGDRPGWARAAFTARAESAFLMSFIHCRCQNGYLFKLRLTSRNPKDPGLQPFINSVQDLVDRAPKKSEH